MVNKANYDFWDIFRYVETMKEAPVGLKEKLIRKLADKSITVNEFLTLTVLNISPEGKSSPRLPKTKVLAGKGKTGLAHLGINMNGRWIDEVANIETVTRLMHKDSAATSNTFVNIQNAEGGATEFWTANRKLLGDVDITFPYLDPSYNVNHPDAKGMAKSPRFKNNPEFELEVYDLGEKKIVNKGSQHRARGGFENIPHPSVMIPALQESVSTQNITNEAHRLAILFNILIPYRIGEISGLTVDDVNLKTGKINKSVRVHKKRAEVHLPPVALAVLKHAVELAREEGRTRIFNTLSDAEIEKEYKKGQPFGQDRSPEGRITDRYVTALTESLKKSGLQEILNDLDVEMGRDIKGASDLRKILPSLLVYQLDLEEKDFKAISDAMGHAGGEDSTKLFAVLPKISSSYIGRVMDPNRPDKVKAVLTILQDLVGEHFHNSEGVPTPVKYANNIPEKFGIIIPELNDPTHPLFKRIPRTEFAVLDYSDVEQRTNTTREKLPPEETVKRPSVTPVNDAQAAEIISDTAALSKAEIELKTTEAQVNTAKEKLHLLDLQSQLREKEAQVVEEPTPVGQQTEKILSKAQEASQERTYQINRLAEVTKEIETFTNQGLNPPQDLLEDAKILQQLINSSHPAPAPKAKRIPDDVANQLQIMQRLARKINGVSMYDVSNLDSGGLYEAVEKDPTLKERLIDFIERYDAIAENDPKAISASELIEQYYNEFRNGVTDTRGRLGNQPEKINEIRTGLKQKYGTVLGQVATKIGATAKVMGRTSLYGLGVLASGITWDSINNEADAKQTMLELRKPTMSPLERYRLQREIDATRRLANYMAVGEQINPTLIGLNEWYMKYIQGQSEEVARKDPRFLSWQRTKGADLKKTVDQEVADNKKRFSKEMTQLRLDARTDPTVLPPSTKEFALRAKKLYHDPKRKIEAEEQRVLDPLIKEDISARRIFGGDYEQVKELGLDAYRSRQKKHLSDATTMKEEAAKVEKLRQLDRLESGLLKRPLF